MIRRFRASENRTFAGTAWAGSVTEVRLYGLTLDRSERSQLPERVRFYRLDNAQLQFQLLDPTVKSVSI